MFKAKEHVVWRKKKKLLVLLDTKSGCYFTLNTTGQDLWLRHIVEGAPLDEVVTEISGKYVSSPGDEQILADCNNLINDWSDNQLIERQE